MSPDLLLKEIVATKLKEMISSVAARQQDSTKRPSYPPSGQLLIEDEVAPTAVSAPQGANKEHLDAHLDSFLESSYPRKYKAVTSAANSLWSCDSLKIKSTNWRRKHDLHQLNKYLQVVTGNNPEYCAVLLRAVANSHEKLQKEMNDETDVNNEVIFAIKSFIKTLSANGCKKREDKEALTAILTACTYNLKATNKNILRDTIGVCKKTFYGSKRVDPDAAYKHKVRIRKQSLVAKIQKECVLDFCHSDESSRIDSNSHRIVEVKGPDGKIKRHVGRVWSALTINDQYKMFTRSTAVQTYRVMYNEEEFTIPSRSFFHVNKCKCVRLPTTQSCVDITVSKLQHYMRAILNFLITNRSFKRKLYYCACPYHDWEKLLGGTVEGMVNATCCPRSKKEHLCVGVGLSKKEPSFLKWKCVNGECNNCGIEKMLGVRKCELWSKFTADINEFEWVQAVRQGATTGRQNMQLEVQSRRYEVSEVLKKLEDALAISRKHQGEYEWKGWMRKIDMEMCNPDKHRVICTDFGATLDLSAAEKDNCSVNNHAVIAIYFVLSNWRTVEYKKSEEEYDKAIMNDCDKWLFFGDTISRGKKNDHVFHNSCLTHIIQFHNDERTKQGKGKIPINIVHTDNCAPQYKCRQNFLHIAKACDTRDGSVVHKFAQKYRFKGSWDATGKLIKQAINRLELSNVRLPDAKTCYFKLRDELGKDGSDPQTLKLLEYKKSGDKRMLKNTMLTSQRTFIGLGVESKEEFSDLTTDRSNKHIVFTDRENVPHMKTISGTQNFFQVQGSNEKRPDGSYNLDTFKLQCSCTNCLDNPQNVELCLYLQDRCWKRTMVSEIYSQQEKEMSADDYKKLTVPELKDILSKLGLTVSGRKDELIQRIMQSDHDATVLSGEEESEEEEDSKSDESESEEEQE